MELIALLTLLLILAPENSAAALPADFPISKHNNCTNHCGNIPIPYPFGLITESWCYLNEYFSITCENDSKAFLMNDTIQVSDILLEDGQLRVMEYVAHDCFAPNSTRVSSNHTWLELPPYHYTVNDADNRFTIVGCDSYGYITGSRMRNRNYTKGCTATCDAVEDLVDGSCAGMGCCQSMIPKEVTYVEVQLDSYDNFTNVNDFSDCSYAFLVEKKRFRFSPENLTNLKDVEKLPMLVDWTVGNETCDEAKRDFATSACKSENSRCYDNPKNGSGYWCSCGEGYRGNPYLENGCQDINECENPSAHNCLQERCVNKQGGFKCSCPKGYRGDGRRDGQGCFRDKSYEFKLVAGIALGVIALMIAACWTYFQLRRRRLIRMKQTFFFQNGGMLLQEKLAKRERSSSPDKAKLFTSSELKKATNNFHDSMIIGRGGYGTVYKGILQNNKIVAIKKSKQVDPTQINPTQIEQFINEVIILSQINHRNVVRLLGCCLETQVPLLVYEFIDNGTLNENIHNKAKAHFLDWDKRLKIAADTAGVLSYLHSAASTPIIHRDIKSANILLDRNFRAKVSDFGASRLVPMDKTQLSTMVQGTFGYLDPQYMQTNRLSEKSDVYSFGVVLLELLTGRKALSYDRPEEEMNLANYFLYIMRKERLIEILEESIVCEENMEQLMEVAMLAKRCLKVKGEDRPNMREVAMELDGLRLGKDSWAPIEDDVQEVESLYSEELSSTAVLNDYGDIIRI